MVLPISSFKQDNPIEVEFVISLNKSIGKSKSYTFIQKSPGGNHA